MKRLSIALTVLLLFQTMFSGVFTFAQAEESLNNTNDNENTSLNNGDYNEVVNEENEVVNEENEVVNEEDSNNLLDSEELDDEENVDEITEKESNDDSSGNSVTPNHHDEHEGFRMIISEVLDGKGGEPYTPENPLGPYDEFWLLINWELDNNHNYKAGDYETIQLPPEILITEDILGGELRDDSGNLIATYEVSTDGIVTLTFTEFVEEHSNVSGWIEIYANLDHDNVEEEAGEIIIGPIEDEGSLTVPIDRSQIEKTIDKQGEPNKAYNADEIEWTITINKNALSFSDVTLEDILPTGTEYVDGSMEAIKYPASINGTPTGDSTPVDISPVYEDGKLSVSLGDINEVYVIKYTTKITDMDETYFQNQVSFKDSKYHDVGTHASVVVKRAEPLNKGVVKNYDHKTGIIEWYIEFNYDEKQLNDVTLSDYWEPEGKVELMENSVMFQEVKIDEDGRAIPEGEPIDANEVGFLDKKENGFEVTEITTDKAYYVTYKTKVIDRELDGFTLENIASFEGHKDGENHWIGQYVGAKSAGKIDYAEKTIEWTIRVNVDEHLMKDVIITDTLGDGLILISDSIAITIGGEQYTDFVLEEGNPFKITNIGDIEEEMIITYKTSYDPNQLPEDYKAHNKANIDWIPEGSDDRINRDVEANTTVNQETIDSSWKYASYNPDEKEIEWTIITNYRENFYEDFTIIDTPQGNQKLLEDSIEVYELIINSDGSITIGDQVSVTSDITDGTITISLGETDKAYVVKYKTSVAGISDLAKTYENKAEIKDGDEIIADLEASVDVYGDIKYGAKTGEQEGKQIHWSISVNAAQELISNLKLTDTITDNQDYLEDTIKVYEASLKSDGTLEKLGEYDSENYELQIEENEFIVSWNEDVERPFIVEYSTLFFAGDGEEVTNSYKITGDNIEPDSDDSSGSGKVLVRQTGSGAQGETGYLLVQKLDTTYGQNPTPIEGIEFELIDPGTGKVLKTVTTDADGYADFSRLLFGDYILKEVNTPEGYVGLGTQQIKVNEPYNPEENNPIEYVFEVENYVPNYNIELVKVDNDNNVLAGAEFTLFTEGGIAEDTKTTDNTGTIIFENIEPGNYYIEETKAPEGYELDSTRYPVEVIDEQKEPIQLEIENDPVRTSIDVKKEWLGSEEDSVTIKLLADGIEIYSVELNEKNDWKYTFENLLVYNYGSEVTEIVYTVVEEELDGYTSIVEGNAEEGFTVTNVRSGKTEVSVEKLWKGEETDSITIKLLANGVEVDTVDLSADNDWSHVFENLPKYDEEGAAIEYTVDEVEVDGYITEITGDAEEGFTVTNTRTGFTDITIDKHWLDEGETDRPDSITVNLLQNGVVIGEYEISAGNDWTLTISDLDQFDEEGQEYVYTITEHDVPGYESKVEEYEITNTRVGEKSITITKAWLDDESSDRPGEIEVELYRSVEDGELELVDTYTVSADEDWELTIDSLPSFNDEGKAYTYEIVEVDVEGYESTINGFDLVNLRVGETEVAVEKVWKGEETDSVTIKLLANGVEVDTVDLSADNSWFHIFENLPKYDEEGAAIEYTVDEVEVDGYTTEITGDAEEGFTVTNTRTGFTDITIDKHWLDEGETDRPDSITVNLLQNGVVIGEYEISAGNDWTLTISDLDQFDEEGQEYVYTITEHDVPGYESKVEEYEITNTRVGEKSITITKAWLDDESSDRPGEIEVELYRSVEDGELELVDTYTVSADEDWELTIDSLPSFNDEGKAYTYEIVEVDVEGYESTINGFDLVNLRVGETEVAVEKVWLGSEEDHVTIDLFANGVVVDTVDLSADNNWSYVFENLPEFDEEGAAIEYTVDEVEVDGYTTEITGDAEEGFTVTNTRTGVTELVIEKLWEKDEADSRPDSIVVDVFQNGDLMSTIEISEANDWIVTLDLPKYDENGEEYVYTIEEHSVEGYDTEITETDEGFTITNTFIPEEETPEDPENPEDPDNGDELPKTATNMYNYLLIGAIITLLGLIVTVYARRTA